MNFGCAWYPEQWDEAVWEADLRLMSQAHMNVVRVAEFAWSRMEPREGEFQFDWLERAITKAAGLGLRTVLGTPTAAPPAWLTQKYPEVLRLDPQGRPARHGSRGHFNPASPKYLHFCRCIAEQMARRFGRNPHVLGWQIDNEYWPFSYDPGTTAQFQEFLKERYGTLERLNRAWTTAYWSQEYSDWTQIPMSTEWQNPCLVTEFRRFFTHVYRRYQQNQVDAIRAHAEPRQWITHNFHGRFEHGDPFVLCAALDHASWDPYVGTGHLDFIAMGLKADLVRGFKRKNFWVMETQPGWVNWAPINNPLDRGEVRAMAWHLAGHGAEAVLYWQWRSALGGQEQYHGNLVHPNGKPRPLYAEVARIGEEFSDCASLLQGTTPQPQVAIPWSFDDRWAILNQKHHRDFDTDAHVLAYYRPLRALGLDVDVVPPAAPLEKYPLVITPHLHLLDGELAKRLAAYARNGGHLLLGARSGMKDSHNALLPAYQPGPVLAEALGGHVEEFYALEKDVAVHGEVGTGQAQIWAEWLVADAPDAQVLLRYGAHSWLDGQAALLTRVVGSGRVSYLGAWLDPKLMNQVAAWLAQVSRLTLPPGPLPEGVELCRRAGGGRELLFVINHAAEPRVWRWPVELRDALSGAACGPVFNLGPRAVRVLVRN